VQVVFESPAAADQTKMRAASLTKRRAGTRSLQTRLSASPILPKIHGAAGARLRGRQIAPPRHLAGDSSAALRRVVVAQAVEPRFLSAEPSAAPHSRDAPQEAPEPAGSDSFDWSKQWYPLSVVEMLKDDRPQALEVRCAFVNWRLSLGRFRRQVIPMVHLSRVAIDHLFEV